MNEDELRAELQQTQQRFEAADAAGDVAAADQFKGRATQLTNRLRSLGQAQGRSPLSDPQQPAEPADGPALSRLKEAEQATNQDIPWSDHWKNIKASAVRQGADLFNYWAASHRQAQTDMMDQLARVSEDEPETRAQLEAKIAKGEQLKPTIYGTFVQPWYKMIAGEEPGKILDDTVEDILATRTQRAKDLEAKPFFQEEGGATYDQWKRQVNVGDPSTWFEGTAMPWEDMDAFLLALSQNSTQIGTSIAAARLGGRAGAMAKARQLRQTGVVNPSVVRAQAAQTGAATGTAAAMGTEYVMIRDNVHSGLQDALKARWNETELWEENPRYTELVEAGTSPEFAKQIVTDEIAIQGGQTAGLVSTVLGAPMNKFWAKLGLEESASRSGAALKGGVGEMLQEGIQESSEQLVSNIHEKQLDPTKPLTGGLANAFFGGAALGAAFGGGAGALSGGQSQAALNKDQRLLNKRGFTEWREVANERSRLAGQLRDPDYMEATTPAQRVADFEQLEELQLKEAKAFKKAEPEIRKIQKKYGADDMQLRRTNKIAKQSAQTIERIERDRKTRSSAEERVATERQNREEVNLMMRQIEEDNVTRDELEQTQEDLETIAGGGLLETDEQHERLIERGYGRWRNKAKREFVLTQPGRVARETIPTALANVESKLESGFAGKEQRTDLAKRAKLEQMPEDQRQQELWTDDVTHGPTKRAFKDIEQDEGQAPAYAAVDVDSLKWVNDKWGHPTGDKLLREVGKAARKAGVPLYRIGGDEFVIRAESEEEAERMAQAIRRNLDNVWVVGPEGDRVPPRLTWATGTTYAEADLKANQMKELRTVRGLRMDRNDPEATPFGYRLSPDIAPDFPIMSQDEISDRQELIDSLVKQVAKLSFKNDEFSQKRKAALKRKMLALQTQENAATVGRAVRNMDEHMTGGPRGDRELGREYMALPQVMKQHYEIMAGEFYTPLAGEHISAIDAYKLVNDPEHKLWEKIPSRVMDAQGGVASNIQKTEMFAALNRIVEEEALPSNVLRALDNDTRRLQEMGMESATRTHAMMQRVTQYLGGEYMANGPSPFNENVDAYKTVHEQLQNELPKMMMEADPLAGPGYYNDLQKGDRVEIIVNSQSVQAVVTSSDPQSVVLQWDKEQAAVFDPDTRSTGNSARFSKKFGWQGSARLARGGTSYGRQKNMWPGQARMGRRYNPYLNEWETFENQQNRIVKVNGTKEVIYDSLRPGMRNKATRNEMRRARVVAQRVTGGFSNLPKIQLANTVADLPAHMQEQLASHGRTGLGVAGMFDEKNPANGVWILVGNAAEKARQIGIPFEQYVGEAVVHETIGHYGLRGIMGNQDTLNKWMDAIEKAFPQQVQAKGYAYGYYRNGKWLTESARRLAAEEVVAEESQYLWEDTTGLDMSQDQKNLLQRFFDWLKGWLIDHGYGRLVRVSDQDLYNLVRRARDFAQSGKGWEFTVMTGRTLVPQMKDNEVFRAAILTQFYEGTRATTKEERKQMQQKGLEPLKEVPMFTDGMKKGALINQFKQLVSKKLISKDELEFTEVVNWVENLTYQHLHAYGGKAVLPENVLKEYQDLEELAFWTEAQWYDKRNKADDAWRKAEKLRDMGTLFGMDAGKAADELRVKAAKFAEGPPTQEARDEARMQLDDLLARPVGKRTGIPAIAVQNFLEQASLVVLPRVAGGYDLDALPEAVRSDYSLGRGEEIGGEVDVTEERWRALSPMGTAYSGYSTIYSIGYHAYVLYQANPRHPGEAGHGFDTGRHEGQMAHIRFAEGFNADGEPALVIVEVQSDAFQKKDKAFTSIRDRDDARAHQDEIQRRLKAAAEGGFITPVIDGLVEAWTNLYEQRYDEIAAMTSSSDDRTEQIRRLVREVANPAETAVMEQAAAEYEQISDKMIPDVDVRAFDRLDRIAYWEGLKAFENALSRARGNFDPRGVISGEPDTQTLINKVRNGYRRVVSPEIFARLVAKPDLAIQFMNDTVGRITGKTYGEEDYKKIQALAERARPVEIVLSEDVVNRFSEAAFSLLLDGKRVVIDALDLNRDVLDAFGWRLDDLRFNPEADGTVSIKGYVAEEGEVSLEDAIKAALHQHLEGSSELNWEAREDKRINDVKFKIQEQTHAGRVSDFEAANNEIGWEEGDVTSWSDDADSNKFADRMTEKWIDRHREWGELSEHTPHELVDENGIALDGEHPEYRSRLQIDEDGDVDTEDAQEWLTDARDNAIDAYWETGAAGYTDKWEEFENYFDRNFQETVGYYARIPIAWDEFGTETEWAEVEAAGPTVWDNELDYEWDSEPIQKRIDYRIMAEGDSHWFSESDIEDAQAAIHEWALNYYQANGITPPESSAFHIPVDENLRERYANELVRREPPDFDALRAAFMAEDGITKSEQKVESNAPLKKQWEDVVRIQKRIDQGFLEGGATPMRDRWQEASLKFAIAHAVRLGKKSIVWQTGEASASRGGDYFKDWSYIEYFDWAIQTIETQGQEIEVLRYKDPDGNVVLMDMNRARMHLGPDIFDAVMAKAADPDEIMRGLRRRFGIVPVGEKFSVVDRGGSESAPTIISTHPTALGAEKSRANTILEHAENNPEPSGRFSANKDIDGNIPVTRLNFLGTNYADTIAGGSRLLGARTNYDMKMPQIMKKLASPFKDAEYRKGGMEVSPDQLVDIKDKETGREYTVNAQLDKDNPNLRIEQVGGEGFIIMSDNPDNVFPTGRVHLYRGEAQDELNAMIRSAEVEAAGQPSEGKRYVSVHELKISDEMREFYGAGNIPIMMGGDPINRNPILKGMAKKVGAVPTRLTLGQRFDQWRKDWKAKFNYGVFDKFYGIKYAMDRAGWQGSAERDPYISARLTTGLDSQMRAIMNYGFPVWEEGMMVTGGKKGLLDILSPVSDPAMMRAWSLYMVARRSQRLMMEGREALITPEEIAHGLALAEEFPIFQQVAMEYAEFNRKVLDFAEAAGVIDPETRPMWEHADYVPFYRVNDDRLVGPLHPNIGIANQRKPIKQLKGGEQAISDIPSNIIQNITQLVESATKNQAAMFAVDALHGTGIVTKAPSLVGESGLVPMAQVKKSLINSGLDPNALPDGALTGLQKMMVMKPPSGEGVISILRDGKREYYQTTDRLLWASMTMINQKQFGRWMGLFRGPKRFLTQMVTLDPGFTFANYARDLLSSFVQSRDVGFFGLPKHMGKSLQGLKQAMRKDESFRTMMSAGAAFDSGYINYGDPNAVHRAIRKAQRKKGFRRSLLDNAGSIVDFYKEFGASFENANRIAVYNEAIENGKSKKQAAFESKDLMDFSMGGGWPAVQFLIQSVPFFGARLQGLHRLGRGFADDPVAFSLKGLLLTMAGMSVYMMFREDERYKELEEWDKDTYFHFWIGNEHYRLPKPFEVGAVFNTIPERAVELYYNEADDAEKLALNRLAHMLGETFAFNPVPQLAMPAFENAFNYNFFTGRSVVSPYTSERMPPEQFRPTTSPTLVETARALPEGLDKINKKYRSPLYLENLYRGYTGTLGRYALWAADEMTRAALDYPERPKMQPADYPVVGRFYRGTDDMPRRTKYEETFYQLLRETKEIQGSLRFLEKVGADERQMWLEEHKEEYIGLAKDLDKARREISEMNADAQQIWMDPEMSAEDKRRELDLIQSSKNEIYKDIYQYRPGAGASEAPTTDDLTYLIEKFGIDEIAGKIEERSPATASLLRDITNMNQTEMGTLAR